MRAPPRLRGGLPVRFGLLLFGLALCGAGIVFTLESSLGLSPWDVLHQGLAKHTPLTFGEANIVVGFAVVTIGWLLGARIGIGTILNASLIGLMIQGLLSLDAIKRLHTAPLPDRIGLLALGIGLMGAGTGFYLGAGLGAGPRDSLMVVGAERTPMRIGVVRIVLELTALVSGVILGGKVGIGTLAFALLIGPACEAVFWVLERSPLSTPAHVPVTTTRWVLASRRARRARS